jgi:hypothetical protein
MPASLIASLIARVITLLGWLIVRPILQWYFGVNEVHKRLGGVMQRLDEVDTTLRALNMRVLQHDLASRKARPPSDPALASSPPINWGEPWCTTCQKSVRPRERDGWWVCPSCGRTDFRIDAGGSTR